MSSPSPDAVAFAFEWSHHHKRIAESQSDSSRGAPGPRSQALCERSHFTGRYFGQWGATGADFRVANDWVTPVMRPIDFQTRTLQAQQLGHPVHMAHLVVYQFSATLPDTTICRKYVQWYTSRCPCKNYGMMLMHEDTFISNWGIQTLLQLEHAIYEEGSPFPVWHLIAYMDIQGDTSFGGALPHLQPYTGGLGTTGAQGPTLIVQEQDATGSSPPSSSSRLGHAISKDDIVGDTGGMPTHNAETQGETEEQVIQRVQAHYSSRGRARVEATLSVVLPRHHQLWALDLARAALEDMAPELTATEMLEAYTLFDCIRETITLHSPEYPRHY